MKKLVQLLLLMLLGCRCVLHGQLYRHPLRSPFLSAMTGCGPSAQALALADHPALIPRTPGILISAFAENQYGVAHFNLLQAAIVVSQKQSGWALLASHLGNIDYREMMASVGYAKHLGKIDIGLSFRYHYFFTRSLAATSCFGYGMNLAWTVADGMVMALDVNDPFRPTGARATSIAPVYALSFGVTASKTVFIEARLTKEEQRQAEASMIFHIQFADRWTFHTGCWPLVFRPFIGLEWATSRFRIGVDVSYHPTLGASPGFLVTYKTPTDDG